VNELPGRVPHEGSRQFRRDERRYCVALRKRFPVKPRALVIAALLFGILRPQTRTQRKADEKTLDAVYAARRQADDFVNVLRGGDLLKRAANGNSGAEELANKIDEDRKRQNRWEISAWTLSESALQPGESISLEMGNGVVAVNGTAQTAISRGLPAPASTAKPDEKIVYMVTAPPEIRSRILMEGLRDDLNNFAAILQFDGKRLESDSVWVSWKSAWFGAQEVFCKYNPGAKFVNLNGEEQTCRASPALQSKTRN
jgi:hypothetical protein